MDTWELAVDTPYLGRTVIVERSGHRKRDRRLAVATNVGYARCSTDRLVGTVEVTQPRR